MTLLNRYTLPLATLSLTAALCSAAGCGSTTLTTSNKRTTAQPAAAPSTVANTPRPPVDAQMQTLIARLEALERNNRALQTELREKELQRIDERRAQLEAMEQARKVKEQSQATGDRAAKPVTDEEKHEPTKPTLADASQDELIEALLDSVVASDAAPRQKALNAAALSLLTRRHDLDHRLLNELDPRSREQVARFHQMIAVTYDQLAADSGARLELDGMVERLSEVVGQQPLGIERVELCRRVSGFGVYDTFNGHSFPAGKLNRMLVYIEIDNFIREPTPDDTFRVKVSVELELYDRRGEVVLWRQQPETIEDESRNRRRDFFLIQPVNLPATLGAGEYRLKVRVKDLHSGSLAESTISDLRLLADPAVAQQGR